MELQFSAQIYNIKSEEQYQDLKNIFSDIATKDQSFKFDSNDEERIFIIFADSLNKLHKRCMWLVHKADKKATIVYKVLK